MTPVSSSPAIMFIKPEPQIPFALTPPTVLITGSRFDGSMSKSSIAPLVATMPCFIPPPSKAGPAEQDAVTIQSEFPTTISPFVPISI
ncbi:hypothetical protein ES703_83481 [subsurface metagenome]